MEELERLFRNFARDHRFRWWIGDRPPCGDAEVVAAIAIQIGLPESRCDPEVLSRLRPLSFADAAWVLARAGTTSLAYDQDGPAAWIVRQCEKGLAALDRNETFLTNGSWADQKDLQWNPLTDATFDCGVIGWNKQNAFVFWVEEED